MPKWSNSAAMRLQESLEAGIDGTVFYLDDSADCKTHALTVSRSRSSAGQAMDILAIRVDSLTLREGNFYEPNEAGYYYRGFVPQTVILMGRVRCGFDEVGNTEYTKNR
jgi:hypothetical protein